MWARVPPHAHAHAHAPHSRALAGYTSFRFTSSQQTTHAYNPNKGWGERVDKTYHLKQDAFMAHADKCLQLGEKPFVSGGMKISSK